MSDVPARVMCHAYGNAVMGEVVMVDRNEIVRRRVYDPYLQRVVEEDLVELAPGTPVSTPEQREALQRFHQGVGSLSHAERLARAVGLHDSFYPPPPPELAAPAAPELPTRRKR